MSISNKNKIWVQIGTNNGNDDFNRLVKQSDPTMVLLIEPNTLKNTEIIENYTGVSNTHIENVIITNTDEKVSTIVIPKNNQENNTAINGVRYDDAHYSLLPMDDWGDVFTSIKTQSTTFNALCKKYRITNVHYLQIDTEGYDVEILKSIDFKKINIDVIKYENWKFSEACFTRYGEKAKLYGINGIEAAAVLLEGLGYDVRDWGENSVAIKREV